MEPPGEDKDESTWIREIYRSLAFTGPDYPVEGLSNDQRQIVHGIRLINQLLALTDQEAQQDLESLLATGQDLQSNPEVRHVLENIESTRSRVRMAQNLLRSIVVSDAHPIQKMMRISRKQNRAGRPPPHLLDASIRALIAAFVDCAREKLGLTEASAAKAVQKAFRRLGLKTPSLNQIRNLPGSEAHGRGSADYKFCRDRLLSEPLDRIEVVFLYDLGRLSGPEAFGSFLDKLITSPPVVSR